MYSLYVMIIRNISCEYILQSIPQMLYNISCSNEKEFINMVRLKDVANYAGVSVSTVSRVLNNSTRVDPVTRANVEEAMHTLGYRPDDIARRLKKNSSEVIGVIIPDISNPFFASVVRGVEREAVASGYSVVLCDTDSSVSAERNAVSLLEGQRVAGIISASVAAEDEFKEIYNNLSANVVFIDNLPPHFGTFSTVTIDNFRAAFELASVLCSAGKRDIGIISGPDNESSAAERLKGFLSALEYHGVEIRPERIAKGDNGYESGYDSMKKMIANGVPDALLAGNNFMAYGAVKAITEESLSFPTDIAVAAFDIIDYSQLVRHKFISANQPAADIGVEAAKICIEKSVKDVVLPHSIE